MQFEYFDLCDLKTNNNIRIVGPHNCGKTFLRSNILYIFRAKGCRIIGSNDMRITYTHPDNQFTLFNIEVINYYTTSIEGIIFMHATLVKKKLIDDGTYEFYNEEDFLDKYMFFVLHNNKILFKCKAEHSSSTYYQIYNRNPFCYNNVVKLTHNIKNKYSMFHETHAVFDHILQSKLKKLYMIYSTIFFVKNNENKDKWLPSELNIEIIKLFSLLCLK